MSTILFQSSFEIADEHCSLTKPCAGTACVPHSAPPQMSFLGMLSTWTTQKMLPMSNQPGHHVLPEMLHFSSGTVGVTLAPSCASSTSVFKKGHFPAMNSENNWLQPFCILQKIPTPGTVEIPLCGQLVQAMCIPQQGRRERWTSTSTSCPHFAWVHQLPAMLPGNAVTCPKFLPNLSSPKKNKETTF